MAPEQLDRGHLDRGHLDNERRADRTTADAADPRCPVCGNPSAPYRAIGAYQYVRCLHRATCGHVWLRNIPSPEALDTFYGTSESTLWNSGAFAILDDYRANPDLVRRYFRRERLNPLPAWLKTRLDEPCTRVFDIGCSSGVFLATLRDQGLTVQGHDIATAAIEAGRRRLGLDLSAAPLESEGHDINDVVTCYDVIEHWRDPRALVRAAFARCAPGGAFVVRTPNHASWLRMLTGRRWLWYIPPAHIHLFTPNSLRALLRQEGFNVKGGRTGVSTYLFLLAYYLLPWMGVGRGDQSINMPRWRERLYFGLDKLVRLAAWPLLAAGRATESNPCVEIYAVRK